MPGFRLKMGKDGEELKPRADSDDPDAIYGGMLFEESQAADARSLDDERWYECPREARAQMVAYERAKRMIERIFAERAMRNVS